MTTETTGANTLPDEAVVQMSPNELLSIQVADALVSAGMIKETHKAQLLSKLKVGGVKQEDWNLWVDMATAPQETPNGGQQ